MVEALFSLVARLIAVVLGLVFVAGTVAVLQARSADRVLLDPLAWELALAESNVYLKLPDLVAAEASHHRDELAREYPEGDVRALAVRALEPEDWKNLTRLLLPATEVQKLVEDGIEQAFAFVAMEQDEVAVDLTSLKRHARGKAGTKAVEVLAGALPECGEPGCPTPTQAAAAFDPATNLDRFPDRWVLKPGPDAPDWRKDVARGRSALGVAPLALGILLVVTALFGARSRAGWLRWTGVPLLAAGLLAIGLGAAAGSALDQVWVESTERVMSAFSLPIWTQVRAVAEAVIAEFVRHLQFEGGVVAIAGLALTLLSFFVPERRLA